MTYIDGYVFAVKTDRKEDFIKHDQKEASIFKDYGAISLTECWGDDIPDGKVTSFPLAVKKEADETVVLGWIVWPDKTTRDAGMAKAMEDPRFQSSDGDAIYDGKRMIFGGFEVVVEA